MNDLIQKFLDSTLTKEEEKNLYNWVQMNSENLEKFKNQIYTHGLEESDAIAVDVENQFKKLEARIHQKETKVVSFNWSTALKYAAAIAIVVTTGFYVFNSQSKATETQSIVVTDTEPLLDSSKITLTRGDGTAKNIEEDKEQLSYLNGEPGLREVVQNHLVIPKGSVFKVVLSDSTLVWLNSDSKFSYPSYFADGIANREVYLDGEAYFDVAPNAELPFIVKTKDIQVSVLGTEFNVSSYENNEVVATTLVEGSVLINENDMEENAIKLRPNYQASFNKTNKGMKHKKVNVKHYTAWMQNRIVFQNKPLKDILKQIERTYNVVIKNNNVKISDERFTGEFDIEDIETVFKALSTSIDFNYEINQNQVVIKK